MGVNVIMQVCGGRRCVIDDEFAIWHKLHESDIIFTYISYKIVFISMFIGIILLSGIKYHEYFSRDTYR